MSGSGLVNTNIQMGASTTPSQNFVMYVPPTPDGTMKLARGNFGATVADILTVDALGNVKIPGLIIPTIGRNVVVNGGCEMAQLYGTSNQTLANSSYPIDNCKLYVSQTGKIQTAQNNTYSSDLSILVATTLAAYSPLATDYFTLNWTIDGLNFRRFGYGGAGGFIMANGQL